MTNNELICIETLTTDILNSMENDFSWSGLTACDCGTSPVDCCMSGVDDDGTK